MKRLSELKGVHLKTRLCAFLLLATVGCMGTEPGVGPTASEVAGPVTLAEVCASVPCRAAGEFHLKGPDGRLQRFQTAKEDRALL